MRHLKYKIVNLEILHLDYESIYRRAPSKLKKFAMSEQRHAPSKLYKIGVSEYRNTPSDYNI